MKKIVCVVVFFVFVATAAFCQMTTPQAAPEPSVQELQWKVLYLQEKQKTLQAEYANVTNALKDATAQLKAKQDAIKESTVPDKPKDKEKKSK